MLVDKFSLSAADDDLSQLERGAKALREFLAQMEARKPVLLAVQLHQRPEVASAGREVQQQAHELADRWRRVYQRGRAWQLGLQSAFSSAPAVRSMLQSLSAALREDTEAVLDAQPRPDQRPETRRSIAAKLAIVEKELQLLEEKAARWGGYVDVLHAPGLSGGEATSGIGGPVPVNAASVTADLLAIRQRLRQLSEHAREQIRLCVRLRHLAKPVSPESPIIELTTNIASACA